MADEAVAQLAKALHRNIGASGGGEIAQRQIDDTVCRLSKAHDQLAEAIVCREEYAIVLIGARQNHGVLIGRADVCRRQYVVTILP
jgi:hypothetical protein